MEKRIDVTDGGVVVAIDKDPEYEMYSMVGWAIHYFLWIPFVSCLAIFSGLGVRVFTHNEHTRKIRRFAKSFRSLELMYGYKGASTERITTGKDVEAHFWELAVRNAAAVRNRLKLVKRVLREEFIRVHGQKKAGEPIRILCLASGSARGVIEALAELKDKGIAVDIRFVDISRSALAYSAKLADEAGVARSGKFEWFKDDVMNVRKYLNNGWQPDVVEMVGLMDYLTDHQAIALSSIICDHLAPGGVYVTCNVVHNAEKLFVIRIVDWDMIYKTHARLGQILVEAGFAPANCRVVYEPLRVHGLTIGHKE